MQTVLKTITGRRSVRRFSPDPVPREVVEQLLEAAVHAPSAGNLQPWEFYVVWGKEQRVALAGAALGQTFVAEAPVVIVVCAVPARAAERYGQRGLDLYCIQDTAAAVQNILLTATAHGLGTCWVGAFNEEAVRRSLNLAEGRRPVAIIPVGYPQRAPRDPGRRPVAEVAHFLEDKD